MAPGTLRDFLPHIRAGFIVLAYPLALVAFYFAFLFITPLDGELLFSGPFIGQLETFTAFFAGVLIAKVAPNNPVRKTAFLFPLIGLSILLLALLPETSTEIFLGVLAVGAANIALVTIAAVIGAHCAVRGEAGFHLPVVVYSGLFLACLFVAESFPPYRMMPEHAGSDSGLLAAVNPTLLALIFERTGILKLSLMLAAISVATGFARPREALHWPIFFAFLIATLFYQFQVFAPPELAHGMYYEFAKSLSVIAPSPIRDSLVTFGIVFIVSFAACAIGAKSAQAHKRS